MSVFQNDKRFSIDLCIDKNLEKAKQFSKFWKINNYSSSLLTLKNYKIDLLIISVNTGEHFKLLKEISRYDIKYIICEKPFCSNFNEAKEINELFVKSKKIIFINYTRAFNESFLFLKNCLENKKLGNFENGSIHYMKGIKNNCSHAIYLLTILFSELYPNKLLSVKPNNKYSNDLDIDFTCYTKNKKPIYFLANTNNKINYFQILLFFEKGYVEITDMGTSFKIYKINARNNKLNLLYYDKLKWKKQFINFINEIYNQIKNKKKTKSNLIHSLKTNYLCDYFFKKANIVNYDKK